MKKPGAIPPAIALTPAPAPATPHREAIYFVKGDASLSPGALAKLKTWTETWGTKGAWTLACSPSRDITYGLLESRILTLRAELGKLGATKVETRLVPNEPPNRYDPVYIELDPSKDRVYTEAFRPPWVLRPSLKVSTSSAKKGKASVKVKNCSVQKKPRPAPKTQLVKLILIR